MTAAKHANSYRKKGWILNDRAQVIHLVFEPEEICCRVVVAIHNCFLDF